MAAHHHHRQLRVLSYNVHSGVGGDGAYDLARIGAAIAREAPDIVALQKPSPKPAASTLLHHGIVLKAGAFNTSFHLVMEDYGSEDLPLTYNFGYNDNTDDPYSQVVLLSTVFSELSEVKTQFIHGRADGPIE